MGIRQTRPGRLGTNVAGIAVVLGGLLIFWTDNVITLLDHSPTTKVLLGAFDGYDGKYRAWLIVLAVLVIPACACCSAGRRGDRVGAATTR